MGQKYVGACYADRDFVYAKDRQYAFTAQLMRVYFIALRLSPATYLFEQ